MVLINAREVSAAKILSLDFHAASSLSINSYLGKNPIMFPAQFIW